MTDPRDDELGAALRALPVPDHGPEFAAQLAARLEETAVSAKRPSRAFRWQRPTFLLTAAAVIATVAFTVTALLPENNPTFLKPRIATAAEVRTRVAKAFATARTLQGELSFTCAVPYADCYPPEDGSGPTTLRWRLAAAADGSERITAIDGLDDHAYDASTRAAREFNRRDNGFVPAAEYTGLPAGPPDFTFRTALRREFGSLVRVFLATTANAPVTENTVNGRDVWQLRVPVQPNKLAGPGNSGDQLDVTVDRETGFPTHVVESLAGRALFDAALTGLVVNAPLAPNTFTLAFPAGTRPFRQDYGFRPVELADAAAALGYDPVLPRTLPDGYQLADVTVARASQPTGAEGMNPPGDHVLSVAYRRGFDRIVVTNRLTGPDPSVWEDPVATGEGFPDQREPVDLTGGAMAGARAQVVITPRGIPHAWAVDDDVVVTIAGDATGEELRALLAALA